VTDVPYLLDTNVVSELRKASRCHPAVQAWRHRIGDEETFLSVIVLGELRQGIEMLRRRDISSAHRLDIWFNGLRVSYAGRILAVTAEVCHEWGANPLLWPLQTADALIAATAAQYELTVATRNERDFQRSGVDYINPFEA
jgi:toxin FitB